MYELRRVVSREATTNAIKALRFTLRHGHQKQYHKEESEYVLSVGAFRGYKLP